MPFENRMALPAAQVEAETETFTPPGLRVPFGLSTLDGRLYEPRAVPLGKACQCECPACHRPLYAKHCLDSAVTPHFQHAPGIVCREGYETAIHLAAKQLIDAERRLFFPELLARVRVRDALGIFHEPHRHIAKPGVRLLSDVTLEHRLGGIRPDLVVTSDDLGRVLVEVAVTHFVNSEKLGKAQSLGLPLLELDLSKLRAASFAELGELIFNRAGNRRWLFHPTMDIAEADLRAALQPKLDDARALAATLAEEEAKRQAAVQEEREHKRRQAEKLRQAQRTIQRRTQREALARATAFKKLPEEGKAEAIIRWLKWDNLPRLVGFPVRGGKSFGIKQEWIWQAALLGDMLNKLATAEEPWTTPNEILAWIEQRFTLTPEFPDSEKRAVWNYLDGLCQRGALVKARGGRFRPAVASLSSYRLLVALRAGRVTAEQLTWVEKEVWPSATVASKIADAHSDSAQRSSSLGGIGGLQPIARSKPPLYICEYYGGSGPGAEWALRYLVCAGFLKTAPCRQIVAGL